MVPALARRPTDVCTSASRTRARGAARPSRPNGGMFPGRRPTPTRSSPWTRSSGKLLWYDQVTKHDVRDYDFEASPIVVGRPRLRRGQGGARRRVGPRQRQAALVAARSGRTCTTSARCPRNRRLVCPGLWGGVLTPMAYADGRLFVPVVERCMRESAIDPAHPRRPASKGDGDPRRALGADRPRALEPRARLAGHRLRDRRRDVVFAPTLDGRVLGVLDDRGRPTLWQTTCTRAGINGCPSVAGRRAARRRGRARSRYGTRRAGALRLRRSPGYVSRQCGRLDGEPRATSGSSARKETADRLLANVETVVHGKRDQIQLVLAALVCRGHVLFEDVPGHREDRPRPRDRRLDRGRDAVARSSARPTCSRPT